MGFQGFWINQFLNLKDIVWYPTFYTQAMLSSFFVETELLTLISDSFSMIIVAIWVWFSAQLKAVSWLENVIAHASWWFVRDLMRYHCFLIIQGFRSQRVSLKNLIFETSKITSKMNSTVRRLSCYRWWGEFSLFSQFFNLC